jgi:hypothetical protein
VCDVVHETEIDAVVGTEPRVASPADLTPVG